MNKPASGWCVDGSCCPNPGIGEYQGINLTTNKILFNIHIGYSTNNISEFLALVHALSLAKKENNPTDIYSDSKTAIAWVRDKRYKTNVLESLETKKTYILLGRAIKWLTDNTYDNKIIFWDKTLWGENPADFGKK
jgi:ribonuclease HI